MLPSTKLEQTMSAELVAKFGKRLTEGYDVTHDDLSVLGDQEHHEYIMWKAWMGTKLQEQSENSKTSCRPKEQALNEADKESDASSDVVGTPPSTTSHSMPGAYYAVFFYVRRSKRGRFYIGCALDCRGSVTNFKFLEKLCGSGPATFDWSKRDEIVVVDANHILCKVEITGVPPFVLTRCQDEEIESLVKKFKS